MEYKSYTGGIVSYIQSHFGVEPEFLWAKSPNNAIFRRKDSGKWFAVLLMDMPRQTLLLPAEEPVDVMNIKCDPRIKGSLLDGRRYLPGFHMNKEHWVTMVLDGRIPQEEVCSLLEMSFDLNGKRKGK